MKRLLTILLLGCSVSLTAGTFTPPDEGMWLPMFVERLNYVDMAEMGLQLTAEEIYSINNSSLKDAIVGLSGGGVGGFFCTGEIVSDKGLMFTNHHCGYNSINELSTPEHNYLEDGFWARTIDEELSVDGLAASFLIKMDNVTDSILPFLSDTMTEGARSAKVQEISDRLENALSEDDKYNVVVRSFFGGNEYYRFVYETYTDVRFVGAPPAAIGKYGGDTDNWMWPRHTGDFSIFRVYSSPDGSPAEYAEENVPFKPKSHIPISLNGVEEDDFAMIWGYPGGTDRYMTSAGIEYNINVFNPSLIEIFGKKLEIWKKAMDADKKVKLELASQYASTANGWKYFIGQTQALIDLKVYDRKVELEEKFTKWVNNNPDRKEKYGEALTIIGEGYDNLSKMAKPFFYAVLAGYQGADIIGAARQANGLYGLLEDKKQIKANEEAINETVASLKESAEEFYSTYNVATDMEMFTAMIKLYMANVAQDQWPEYLQLMMAKFKGNTEEFVVTAFEKSVFSTREKAMAFLDNPKFKILDNDPMFQVMLGFRGKLITNSGPFNQYQASIGKGDRLFIDGLRKMYPDKVFYPDANSTMRLTYGTVMDYYPADAVHYNYFTTLAGVMEKEDPDSDEFIVPEKLKELFQKKDYGRYGQDGKLITCFLTTNDITGGNSGSPVINGNGELIGIAFDGNWEAMSGDIIFENELQRCINVDIRYVLFIIDKFAGAQNLIDELTIIKKTPQIKEQKQDKGVVMVEE